MVTDHKSKDQENNLINKSEWIILCVPIDKTLEVFDSIKNKIRKIRLLVTLHLLSQF